MSNHAILKVPLAVYVFHHLEGGSRRGRKIVKAEGHNISMLGKRSFSPLYITLEGDKVEFRKAGYSTLVDYETNFLLGRVGVGYTNHVVISLGNWKWAALCGMELREKCQGSQVEPIFGDHRCDCESCLRLLRLAGQIE